jgi:hypothetical protein
MSDENERSVASAGSGSGLPAHLMQPEWMELARAVTFFGVPLDRLSRDELIANIGYLLTQVEDAMKYDALIADLLCQYERYRGSGTRMEKMLKDAGAALAKARLTDDECEAIKRAIDSQQDRAAEMHSRSWSAAAIDEDCDTLRGLLERTK